MILGAQKNQIFTRVAGHVPNLWTLRLAFWFMPLFALR